MKKWNQGWGLSKTVQTSLRKLMHAYSAQQLKTELVANKYSNLIRLKVKIKNIYLF